MTTPRTVGIVVPLTRWSSRTIRCAVQRITASVVYVRAPDGSTAAYERESGRASVVRGGAGGGASRASCLVDTHLSSTSWSVLWADVLFSSDADYSDNGRDYYASARTKHR